MSTLSYPECPECSECPECLREQLNALEKKLNILEKEKEQINERLKALEPALLPIANRQIVGSKSFKNIGSGKYISKGDFLTKSANSTSAADTSENNMFFISMYKDNEKDNEKEYIINGDAIKVLDLDRSNGTTLLFYNKHKHYKKVPGDVGYNQCWKFDKTENGIIIVSCYNKPKNLVLIQKDNTFVCVPWKDIEDTEQEKFAYWQITD